MPELTRREWIGSAGAGVGAACSRKPESGTNRRPNLVFIFSDQQSSDMLGCYGNEQIITPNIDRAAAEGVRFNQCISNSPVCTPYRSILMSGQHPLNTGSISNDFQMLPGKGTYFGEVLRDAGYRMGYIGKWHLYGGDRRRPIPAGPYRLGFDHTFLSNNCTLQFQAGKAYYWSEQGERTIYDEWEPYGQARQAMQFIDENADEPFALFVSWHPPHNWQGRGKYPAPEELLRRYDPAKIRLRANCADTPLNRERYQGYMAMCTSLDTAFGSIMDRLDEHGLSENTLVVYTSDHGDLLYSRGSALVKVRPETESCRVPLIMRWPKRFQPRASDLLVSTLDLMPTLLSLLELPVPKTCQGQSLADAVVRGDDDAVEWAPLFITSSTALDWRGIYTRRYTYSMNQPDRPPSRDLPNFDCLYDRERDPTQVNNLFASRKHKALREDLDKQTRAWMESYGDKFIPYETMAKTILVNPEEWERPSIRGTGILKGRPIDLL